jgi:hypothetical protein|tara:strand:+ start:511 stop:1095 length:585 start_codon:yes stop_codon:yes gene_type:complete
VEETYKEKLKLIQDKVNLLEPRIFLSPTEVMLMVFRHTAAEWSVMSLRKRKKMGNFLQSSEFGKNCNIFSRQLIFNRDHNFCMICGNIFDMDFLNVDHIIPKSKFPNSHPWNLQTLCIDCNKEKSNKILDMIPLFLKGAKFRTEKCFSNGTGSLIKLMNYSYQTKSFNEEEDIFNKIISKYNSWNDVMKYLSIV